MSDPRIGIVLARDRHPAAKALGDLLDADTAGRVLCDEHLPLSEALSRDWAEDAHFLTYAARDEDGERVYARVSKRSPFVAELLKRGGAIEVGVLVFDHDLPDKAEWTDACLGEFIRQLSDADLPSPTYFYTTLHGSRFIYVLSKEVDHLRAEALCRAMIARFGAAGIVLDDACVDWTRLFRLPRTVREDTGQSFALTSEQFMFLDGGSTLDPDSIEVLLSAQAEKFAAVTPYDGELPTAEEVRELLVTRKENGREYPSDWAKTARQYLQGREAFAVCFEDALIDAEKYGGRNNALTKLAGQIVGMTARQENASPEAIYALLYGAVEQLNVADTEGTDWHRVAWDLIARMWANELAQIEAENAERERSIAEGHRTREDILAKLKSERPQDVPADPEQAAAFLKQRMIASNGREHRVMRPDGSYNVKPVGDSMLIPMIRELRMEDVIETHELRGKAWVLRSAQSILNDHATPIVAVQCSAREKVAHIDGERGQRTLHIPVHRLNPKLRPQFSQDVDEWLRVLFGEKYALGVEWLSWALEVGAPICALNLYGAPGAGKGMLVQGLAECFEGEHLNDGRVLGKFNEGLLRSPIVNCDEGVPTIKSDGTLPVDQAFRALVSGGNVVVEAKGENAINANVYPRIIFTSNDRDILRSIIGQRDLTADDRRAIEVRLLSVEVTSEAREWLSARGNYAFTAGWIHGAHSSRYVLANHIAHLHAKRARSEKASGRLLVEGEVDGIAHVARRTPVLAFVTRAMHFMVEAAERKSRDYDSLYVHARRKLHEHYESGNVAAVQAGDVPALAPGLYVTLTALHEVARLLPGFVDLNPKPGPDDLKALLTRAGLLDDPAKTLYVATTGRSKRYLRLVLDRARDAWIADGLDTPRTDELLVDPDSDEEAA